MKHEAQSITLEVSFDIDQISNQLDWSVKATDGNGDPRVGKYAGGILFHKEDAFQLTVTGYGSYASEFSSFDILECCIVTRSQIVECGPHIKARFAPPSPFFPPADTRPPMGPSYQLPLNFLPTVVGEDGGFRSITQTWEDTLTVGNTAGRWDLSFIVMVSIARGPHDKPELRVFSFDPESQVGDI